MKEDKKKDNNSKKNPFDDIFGGFFRDIFGNPMNMNDASDDDIMKKGYSVSYRFGSGMDKPDIRVNGKSVDPKDIDELMNRLLPEGMDKDKLSEMFKNGMPPNMPDMVPQKPSIPILDANQINLPQKAIDNNIPEVEEPLYEIDVDPDKNFVEITMELPSVKKENININYLGDAVLISGETSDNRLFQKRFDLKFHPKSEKTEIDGRNGIYQIILSD